MRSGPRRSWSFATARASRWRGAWFLTPHRSTLSTSGVTGRLQFPVVGAVTAGEAIEYVLRIEQAG
jgi:hypothetical protein